MKDYAKIANTPREQRASERAKAPTKPNLIKTAKELQPKEEAGKKNFFAIFLVLLIAVIVGYGVIHQYITTHNINLSTGKITTALKQAKSAMTNSNSSNNQGNTPQFDFYTVLPKGNAPATTTQASSPSNATSTTPAATAATNTAEQAPVNTINTQSSDDSKYYLDVGNYPTNDDAQQIASQLLTMNISTSINPVQDGSNTVYSVMAGPYPDEATMSIVRTQLTAHNISTTIVQGNQ